jgi:glycerol-3-phosphate O-acyltransferase / dihydroxyacetone phosphate acyltransferase
MRALARLLIHVFFRRVELQGGEHLPPSAPVVLVANHSNGLVDGLLLIAALGRYPRFLGKSTLFTIPPLWPFLKLAGVIPVHRVIDGGGPNTSAFATAHTILAGGGMVAVFPEGISHDESSLQPLKTGAARIALEAGIESGVPGVVTVAVGLTYDAKARFRSRALVRVGEPVGVDGWAGAYRHDGPDAVRRFTDAVGEQLNVVSPPYESWAEAERLGRIAQVVVRSPEGSLPEDVALADQVAVAERLAGVPAVREPMAALRAAFATYTRDLDLLGLSDAQVVARYPAGTLRRTLVWSLAKVLLAVPFAVIGVLVHVVPFQLMKRVSRLPTNESIKATVKLLGCFVLFAAVYAVSGSLAGRAYGAWVGLLVALAAPACGYATVRLGERLTRIGGLVAGARTVRDRRGVLATVVAHRAEVVRTACAVLARP